MVFRRAKIWLAVAMTLLVVVAIAGITLYKRAFPSNYYTSFLFSEQAFAQIRPGMTRDQVRDLLGPPLARLQYQGGDFEWEYSYGIRPDTPSKQLLVHFGKDGLATNAGWYRRNPFKSPDGEWTRIGRGFAAQPWVLSQWDLRMIQGDAPPVSEDSRQLTVVQVMASWCEPCSRIMRRIEAILSELSKDKPIGFMLVSLDSNEADIRTYIRDKGIAMPVAWDPQGSFSAPMQHDVIPHFVIIKGNVAYPFDFLHVSGESESYYDDFRWFVRHCASRQ